jgi:hypothetical protein
MEENGYIRLDNDKMYYLDVEKIVQMFKASERENLSEANITEIYSLDDRDKMELHQRQIDERKISNIQLKGSDSVRINLLNTLIESLLNSGVQVEEGGKINKHMNIERLSIGESISFNTLIKMKILVEV